MNTNSYYDGLDVYKIDLSKLRVGDILLTRNRRTNSIKGRRQADIISAATGGRFSHALLCSFPPTFVEAIGAGVSTLSMQNCFCHDLSDVRLLRYPYAQVAHAAGSWAMTRLGQGYSVRKAVLSVVPNARVPGTDEGTFCSALVATAFGAAGAAEFLIGNPFGMTPADLQRMVCLVDVTASIFQRILSPRNIEQMTALDGDRAVTPSMQQAQIHAQLRAQLTPRIGAILSSYPDYDYPLPETFFECLEFIIKSMAMQPSRIPRGLRAELEVLDKTASELLSGGALDEMISAMVELEAREAGRLLEESFATTPDIDRSDLQNVYQVTLRQIGERSRIFSEPDLPRGASLAWDKWLELTEKTVGAMRARSAVLAEVIARTQ